MSQITIVLLNGWVEWDLRMHQCHALPIMDAEWLSFATDFSWHLGSMAVTLSSRLLSSLDVVGCVRGGVAPHSLSAVSRLPTHLSPPPRPPGAGGPPNITPPETILWRKSFTWWDWHQGFNGSPIGKRQISSRDTEAPAHNVYLPHHKHTTLPPPPPSHPKL